MVMIRMSQSLGSILVILKLENLADYMALIID
ncbi:MAG: hypothetical protein ACI86M_003122, partial [Saprospiraceae bacterium]